MKPLIHFAHANGIPSATYVSLRQALAKDFDLIDIPTIGIDERYPVTNHWPYLVNQLIDSITLQAQGRPVIGVGHSLGGALTLMAARKKPALFSQVIMLDPPLVLGAFAFVVHLTKALSTPLTDRLSPAGRSLKRRDHWDSRQTAAQALRTRGMFKSFAQPDFDAYIRHGLREDDIRGGVTLTIPKMVEVEIFRTNPSWGWLPQRPPQVPTALIVGRDSEFLKMRLPQTIQSKLNIPYSVVDGGHMFPLQHPIETAQAIKQRISLQMK